MVSLAKLAGLPDDTRVYCGHEYTEKNLRFALTLEPGNAKLQEKYRRVKEQTDRGEPTVPTSVADELETNPFLRYESPELRRSIQQRFSTGANDSVEIFARTRELKDSF